MPPSRQHLSLPPCGTLVIRMLRMRRAGSDGACGRLQKLCTSSKLWSTWIWQLWPASGVFSIGTHSTGTCLRLGTATAECFRGDLFRAIWPSHVQHSERKALSHMTTHL